MPFTVMLSPDARKCLDGLDDKRVENIKKHLKELEKDPFNPRAGCDIDIVAGSGRPPIADEQYKKLQKEKDQYISLDEYCAKRGI